MYCPNLPKAGSYQDKIFHTDGSMLPQLSQRRGGAGRRRRRAPGRAAPRSRALSYSAEVVRQRFVGRCEHILSSHVLQSSRDSPGSSDSVYALRDVSKVQGSRAGQRPMAGPD